MVEAIRQAKSLSDEEKQRLFGWGKNIFGVETFNLRWRPKDLHFLFYSNGELTSHVGVLAHIVTVNGESVTVGGVGGVVTTPKAQKQGYARRLMQHTAQFLECEWKVAAGLLFCLPGMMAYYEALGWQRVEGSVLVEQPNGKIISPLFVMTLPLHKGEYLNGRIELCSLPW
ncbi:MAG: GNAT family N-acetyltransferase [Cyanobacteria bacterium P01_H01_bin.105]